MSASREKKKRQESQAAGFDPRAAREAEQKAQEKKSKILYSTVGILFVVATVFLLVFNSGIVQRNKTALTIEDKKYTAADMSYYFSNAYQSFLQSSNGQMAVSLGMLDPSKPLSAQPAFGDPDKTWADLFKEQAVNSAKFTYAAVKAAEAEGIVMDDDDKELLSTNISTMKDAAKEANYSYKAYVAAIFGPLVTPEVYEQNLADSILASKYSVNFSNGLKFTEDEINAYYEENKNSLDFVDGAYVTIKATPEVKTDEDGNVIEATEEEKTAALDAAKKQAQEILDQYKDGKSLEDLAEKNDLIYTASPEMNYYSGPQLDWLFDTARKSGDVEVVADDAIGNVYVVLFNDRHRNDALDYDVRHILVTEKNLELPEGETATEEQIRAKAEEILASWDGTEEGFAALAKENSQDGSAAQGGIYEGVTKGQMVPEFEDWCYEDGRKAGDTGIVKSQFGQHIMYFVGYGDTPYWHYASSQSLKGDAYSEWEKGLIDSVTAETVASGMKLVG